MKLKLFAGGLLLTLMLIYVVQNSAPVPIHFIKWEYTVSQALLVLASLLTGVILGLLLSYGWKNKERNQQKRAAKKAIKLKKTEEKLKKQQEKLQKVEEQKPTEPATERREEDQL